MVLSQVYMNTQKWLTLIIAIIGVLIVLFGFLYLQYENTKLKKTTPSPNPTITPTPTPNPSETATPAPTTSPTLTPPLTSPLTSSPSPSPTPTILPLASSTSTTTHGGTTLICNGSISLGNDGGPVYYINWINITNVGSATAYRVNITIQTYYPNGTLAANVTQILDASEMYAFGVGPAPVNIAPGQTVTLPNSGRYDAYEVYGANPDLRTMGNYTITPVWSSTPN